MSSLAGHWVITRAAVRELCAARGGDPIAGTLPAARLPLQAIVPDLIDLVTLGHFTSAAQKHHFMRRFDGESARDAYLAGVDWIRSRTAEAARRLSARSRAAGRPTARGAGPNPWRPLGDALHALHDSFADGHARRGAPAGPGSPGPIEDVLRFALRDISAHARADLAWRGPNGGLSDAGRLAVEASKALVVLVLDAAGPDERGDLVPGWEAFRERWLGAAPALLAG